MEATGRSSVLVIEDNDDLRELCVFMLEAEGHDVVGAADGEAGLRMLRAQPFDVCVVVLDLCLPKLDGPGFLGQKAEDPRLAAIPVIVLSAAPETLKRPTTDDVKVVLTKPAPIPVLLAEVRRWSRSAEAHSPH